MAKLPEGEYVDPALRQAVGNIASSALNVETDPELAIAKGQLEIKEPPKYSFGSPLNDAVMKRARDKFYDPNIAAGVQKLRHVNNQAGNLQNAANQVMGIYNLDKQAEMITRQRKAAEDSQRAQVLSSVLGLGGTIAGGAIGSAAGPGGTVVGANLGGQVGNQAAGTGYLGANTQF